jgi:hypothetical protein
MNAAAASGRGFFDQPTFDAVVFGDGPNRRELGFQAFRQLPLRERVQLLLAHPARFFRGGVEIPRADAMRYQG